MHMEKDVETAQINSDGLFIKFENSNDSVINIRLTDDCIEKLADKLSEVMMKRNDVVVMPRTLRTMEDVHEIVILEEN